MTGRVVAGLVGWLAVATHDMTITVTTSLSTFARDDCFAVDDRDFGWL